MRKGMQAVTISCALLVATIAVAITVAKGATATPAKAAATERYLHVRVDGGAKGESVNVNVPLSLAEKILPTINHGELHQGRITISSAEINDVDIRDRKKQSHRLPSCVFSAGS